MFFILPLPLIFFLTEGVYFVFNRRRYHTVIRLPFEIVSVVVYPCLFLSYAITSSIAVYCLLILAVLPFMAAYFVAAYKKRIFAPLAEGILNMLLTGGLFINLCLLVFFTCVFDFYFSLIGCLPLIIAFAMALLSNVTADE